MNLASLSDVKTCAGPVGQLTSDTAQCQHGPLRPLEEYHNPECSLMWPLTREVAEDGVKQYHVQYDLDVVSLECTYGTNTHYHLYIKD